MLIYHESARVRYRFGDASFEADPGSVLFFPHQSEATYEVLQAGSAVCIRYRAQATESPNRPMLLTTYAPKQLKDRFLHFANEAASPSIGHEIAMLAHFYGILYDLNRNTAEGNRRILQEDRIRPSVAYLEHRYADRALSMKQIAALSGVSETYFRQLFERLNGCTPMQYVTELRLRHAARLLEETELSMDTIRGESGFGDAGHFVRCFRKHFGVSPEEYRANKIGN